jgi:glucokinase
MGKKEVTLGVDIGGTNTVMGFVDRLGNVVAEESMLTNAHEPAEIFFKKFLNNADSLLNSISAHHEFLGVGIGAPNANYYRGTVEYPPNLQWKGVTPVVEIVNGHMKVPVFITNDANAAAMGEVVFGAARGMKHVIVITLGTGLGSGIIVDGKLLYGADGFAGEIGHTNVDPNGRLCGCGNKGCLEGYASSTGICRTVQEFLSTRSTPSELRNIKPEQLTSKMIYESAMRGDSLALEAFKFTGTILGLKLADSVAHLSPEAIILFGGLAKAGDLIFTPTKRSMEEHLFVTFKNKVKLLPSGLPEGNSAVLGASALVWDELAKQKGEKPPA